MPPTRINHPHDSKWMAFFKPLIGGDRDPVNYTSLRIPGTAGITNVTLHRVALISMAIIVLLLLGGCAPGSEEPEAAKAPGVPANWTDEGFLRADRPRKFSFPQDHGPHQGYRTEWWYVTGNLEGPDKRRFGYQITLFRIALTPEQPDLNASHWRASHVWMAHLALTDIGAKKHYHQERFSREALGLAGAQSDPLSIWVEEWKLYHGGPLSPWRLSAGTNEFSLELELEPMRKPVLQGEEGLSRKGGGAGNASYYYSITRLATSGKLKLGGQIFPLKGLSWLDREWSTSALAETQAGWDWFSLQLDEGSDLMFYRLREKSGSTSPQSAGIIFRGDGTLLKLASDDVILSARRWWKNPRGVRYPVVWEVTVKPLQRRFIIEASFDDQEMDLSVRYWEGAVVVNEAGARIGQGYLELTGY